MEGKVNDVVVLKVSVVVGTWASQLHWPFMMGILSRNRDFS